MIEQTSAPRPVALLRDALVAQDIAFLMGIRVSEVTPELRFEYAVGSMDEGACSVLWLRDFRRPGAEEWPMAPNDPIADGGGA